MALAQEKLYTIDDIYALPDGERAELIEGELYMMTPPGTTHQRIASFLHRTIRNYIQEQNRRLRNISGSICSLSQ